MKQGNERYCEKTITEDGGESSHGFLYRCTCTHRNSVTCINTRFFVNCGVREGNERPAYCLSKVWSIVEAHGHYYDLSHHMYKASCFVLQNLDTAGRFKCGPSKYATIYETKNIPRSTANSSPPEPPISPASVCKFCTMSVAFSWTAVGTGGILFLRVKNKSLLKTIQISRASFSWNCVRILPLLCRKHMVFHLREGHVSPRCPAHLDSI